MADWGRLNILPSNAPASDVLGPRNRVLQDTSGNIQTYASDVKHAGEGLHCSGSPVPLGYSCIQPVHNQLPSNDHVGKAQRLQWRRSQRQRYQHDGKSNGALWKHERYKKYRDRSERGKQRDRPDEEVWPERVEQAFYDGELVQTIEDVFLTTVRALMNIPCYGRKKKSQNNRPHGRNELIALWIKKATGVERSRKQISSHIQVLKTKMKGIPEWDKVSIPQNDDNNLNGPANRYYSNSIEDDVKNFYGNSRSNNQPQPRGVPGPNSRLSLSYSHIDTSAVPHVSGLNFKMWVSPKDHEHFRERFWDYTCSADDQGSPSGPPTNLESVTDWRHSFPDLASIIANHSPHVKFDIILVSAGLKLMDDHPPPRSQLGLNLELDLWPPGISRDHYSFAQTFQNWRGITHIYRYGQPVEDHKPIQFQLCEPTAGRLNTSFESKWWAKQFTLLTECRREAEDSCSDAKLAVSDERIHHFFDGTTAMQEFHADSNPNHRKPDAMHPAAPETGNAIIVLLWKFHQVHEPKVGTTSWQILVPAPNRNMTNSPHPGEGEMSLPPLAIDSRLSSSLEAQQRHSPFHDANDGYSIYPDTLPNPDFMPATHNFDFFRPEDDLASFNPSSFDLPMSDLRIPDLNPTCPYPTDFSQPHHDFDFPPPDATMTAHSMSYNHEQATSSAPPLPSPPQLHQYHFPNDVDTTAVAAAMYPHSNRHDSQHPASPSRPTSSPPLPSRHYRHRPALAELASHVRETHDTLQASLAGPTAKTTTTNLVTTTGTTGSEAMTESAAVVMVSDEEIRAAIAGLEDLGTGAMTVGVAQQQHMYAEDEDARGKAIDIGDGEWVDPVDLAHEDDDKIGTKRNNKDGKEACYREHGASKEGADSRINTRERIVENVEGDSRRTSDAEAGGVDMEMRVRAEADDLEEVRDAGSCLVAGKVCK